MPLFLLTDENVAAAKAALRIAHPAIRSSHLTEALAFGLGFGTHAALRAAIADETGKPPALAESDIGHFAARLAGLGYGPVAPEHFNVALAAPSVPDTPFVVFKRGDMAANNRHHDDCQGKNRPMLMIKTARRYVELEWDCVTINPDQENHLHGETGAALGRTLFARFQALTKDAPGKPYFTGGAFTGWIERLLPETAHRLAEEYFKLLYLPLREPRSPQRRAA